MEPTFENVSKRVAQMLNIDLDDVTPESSFVDDLGADSLDLVEMIMSMEEEFDVEISDAAAEKIITIQDAINYINTALL